jgi:hypothetical protein
MKYLKRQVLDKTQVTGNTSLYIDVSGEVVVNRPYTLLVPKGTTSQRSPDTTSPSYVNGSIRYNTTTNEFEGYQNGSWRSFRFKESTATTLQTVGIGDGSTIRFGPLSPDPYTFNYASGVTWNATQIAKNLLVYVENVPQIPTVNFTIVQISASSVLNPSNPGNYYAAGTYLQFGTAVPANKPVYVLYYFDQ